MLRKGTSHRVAAAAAAHPAAVRVAFCRSTTPFLYSAAWTAARHSSSVQASKQSRSSRPAAPAPVRRVNTQSLINVLKPFVLMHIAKARHQGRPTSSQIREIQVQGACQKALDQLIKQGADLSKMTIAQLKDAVVKLVLPAEGESDDAAAGAVGSADAKSATSTSADVKAADAKAPASSSPATVAASGESKSDPKPQSEPKGEPEPKPKLMMTADEALRKLAPGETLSPEQRAARQECLRALFEDQLNLELRAVDNAVREYQQMLRDRRSMSASLKPSQRLLLSFYESLVAAINADKNAYRDSRKENKSPKRVGDWDSKVVGPTLMNLSTPHLACIVTHELLKLILHMDEVPFAQAALAVGQAVQVERDLQQLRRNPDWLKINRQREAAGATMDRERVERDRDKFLSPDKDKKDAPKKFYSKRERRVDDAVYNAMASPDAKAADEKRIAEEKDRKRNPGAAASSDSAGADEPVPVPADEEVLSPIADSERGYLAGSELDDRAKIRVGAALLKRLVHVAKFNPSPHPPPPAQPPAASSAAPAAPAAAATAAPSTEPAASSAQPAASASAPASAKAQPQPVFRHLRKLTVTYAGHWRQIGFLVCEPAVRAQLISAHELVDRLAPRFAPMLFPPKPWSTHNQGAYYALPTKIMRTHGSFKQMEAVAAASAAGELPLLFAGLSALGAVQWTINSPVLKVAQTLWKQGGGVAGLPHRHQRPLPSGPVPGFSATTDEKVKEQEKAARVKYFSELRAVRKENAERHSMRCDTDLKFSVAKEFEGKTFYFPFNIDFRGRAYPIPPHLNHMGSDFTRGLLKFKESRELGKDGLRWMMIHLANLNGINKLSFDGRAKWTQDRLQDILAAAANPLGKDATDASRWWMKAEEPFQCLAACMEIAAALKHEGGPETFRSNLTVHADGSCNGLQHYAALGRDEWGGQNVNLLPSDVPQDVYKAVCDVVNIKNDKLAEQGNELAKALQGHIVRKVVKQTVMTSVYGVTNLGARDQIFKQIKDMPEIKLNEEDLMKAAQHLAKLTFLSLGDVFRVARQIMDWLRDCASLMGSELHETAWVTPLVGLPVVQPYRQERQYTVRTAMQSVSLADNSDLLPVHTMRQASAFPPNFVHSLDATHMLLTAIECRKEGLVFGSVHDSYWTHAGSMGPMNRILRAQFIRLYEQPILEDLNESFRLRFPNIRFPPVPKRGTLDIKKVKDSQFFFN